MHLARAEPDASNGDEPMYLYYVDAKLSIYDNAVSTMIQPRAPPPIHHPTNRIHRKGIECHKA
jgi:hypothetical protein